jgi:hypothetical protein
MWQRHVLGVIVDNPERIGAASGAMVAMIFASLGERGPNLLILIGTGILVNLFSGLLRAFLMGEPLTPGRFGRGFLRALLVLCLVFPAVYIDQFGKYFGMVTGENTPILFITLAGILMYYGFSIVENVHAVVGDTGATISLLRVRDRLRYGGPLPNKRSYDPELEK